MGDTVIPWGILFYLGVRWLIASAKDSRESKVRVVESSQPKERSIEYFSNGYLIKEPHHLHYLKTLNLLDSFGQINHDKVKAAVKMRLREINEHGSTISPKRDEIIAAADFLKEQMNYVMSFN